MKFDINVIKRKMLVKYPFFGSVIANVSYIEKEEIGTAATDGKTILYNEKFLKDLSIDEQTFVLAHEVCHIAFNHILRSEGKNANIWNIATDAVINQFLKKDGLKIPFNIYEENLKKKPLTMMLRHYMKNFLKKILKVRSQMVIMKMVIVKSKMLDMIHMLCGKRQ